MKRDVYKRQGLKGIMKSTLEIMEHLLKQHIQEVHTSLQYYNPVSYTHLLLYCIDMLNEGIHVADVDGVILLRPTVSPITVSYTHLLQLSQQQQKSLTTVSSSGLQSFSRMYQLTV